MDQAAHETTETESDSKKVIIIGSLSLPDVTDKILSQGYSYQRRSPFSNPFHWAEIENTINSYRRTQRLVGVFMFLTEGALFHSCSSAYREVWHHLLSEMKQTASLIFLPEQCLQGIFHSKLLEKTYQKRIGIKKEDYVQAVLFSNTYQHDLQNASSAYEEEAREVLSLIQESGVDLVLYQKERDIILRAYQFLEDADEGIFLRLYVPNGRYQADQLTSFLRLLESYLQRIEKMQFFIDLRRTMHGQIYVFKSKNGIANLPSMEHAISRFENFMDICQNDPKKAETILASSGISSTEVQFLLAKYIKDYQRLVLDMKHEFEQKTLILQQSLEIEAFEVANGTARSLLSSGHPSPFLSLPQNSGSISINISSPSVSNTSAIQSLVEQTIYGDIIYTSEDRQLLALFEKYAERLEAIRLRSELEQLKDTSSPEEVRKTAKQKIVGFLHKAAPAIGQSAMNILTAYVQKILTGT